MRKFIFLFLIFSALNLRAQHLELYDTHTASQLVDVLIGSHGIRAGNVKITGDSTAFGAFAIDTNVFGMKQGIVLCTGKLKEIKGPNNSGHKTSVFRSQGKQKRNYDKDIVSLSRGRNVYDLTILEFDFVPYENRISFNYAFGSEEYTEFVDTPFNDAFGFFISGPGIKRRERNLAVLGDKQRTPVTINSINQNKNKEYFVNNNPFRDELVKSFIGRGLLKLRKLVVFWHDEHEFSALKKKRLNQALYNTIQYDGLTTKLTATTIVEPYKKYHIRIVICDVSDPAYDSGVFLEGGSFSSFSDTTVAGYKPLPPGASSVNVDSILFAPPVLLRADTVIEPRIDERFAITDVLFDFDKVVIPDTAKPMLDSLADYLGEHPRLQVQLDGFTDSKGSQSYNQRLSERRTTQVMNYLESKGVSKNRMKYTGNNFLRPVAENSTDAGRARNRRVELRLVDEADR